VRDRLAGRDRALELESLGREFEDPREHHDHREPEQQQPQQQLQCPGRDAKRSEQELADLEQDPGRHRVEHRHAKDVTPLEFREERHVYPGWP